MRRSFGPGLVLGALAGCGGTSGPEVPDVVRAALITVTIVPEEAVVDRLETLTLHAELSPRFTKEMFWTTSESAVATITDRGILTALSTGAVQVRACVAGSGERECGTARVQVR
ncbi:MAG: Ig domain-containing protein [Gemmatimonadales bacterium]